MPPRNGICSVDSVAGAQTMLGEFADKAQGVTGIALSIAVVPRSNIVFANGFDR